MPAGQPSRGWKAKPRERPSHALVSEPKVQETNAVPAADSAATAVGLSEAEAAYRKLEPRLAAIPRDALAPLNVDIQSLRCSSLAWARSKAVLPLEADPTLQEDSRQSRPLAGACRGAGGSPIPTGIRSTSVQVQRDARVDTQIAAVRHRLVQLDR